MEIEQRFRNFLVEKINDALLKTETEKEMNLLEGMKKLLFIIFNDKELKELILKKPLIDSNKRKIFDKNNNINSFKDLGIQLEDMIYIKKPLENRDINSEGVIFNNEIVRSKTESIVNLLEYIFYSLNLKYSDKENDKEKIDDLSIALKHFLFILVELHRKETLLPKGTYNIKNIITKKLGKIQYELEEERAIIFRSSSNKKQQIESKKEEKKEEGEKLPQKSNSLIKPNKRPLNEGKIINPGNTKFFQESTIIITQNEEEKNNNNKNPLKRRLSELNENDNLSNEQQAYKKIKIEKDPKERLPQVGFKRYNI